MKFIILFILPVMIFAGNDKLIKEVKRSQARAKKALEILDVSKAKKNALHAISIIERNNLTQRDLAEIYIIAGVLDLTIETGEKAKGYFKKALKLDSTIRIPSNFSSEDVENIFLDAKKEIEMDSYKIIYKYPQVHQKSDDFIFEVMVSPIPKEGVDLFAFYSLDGILYESVTLEKKGKKFLGKISSLKLKDEELKIYLSLLDENLETVASYGTEEKPLTITLEQDSEDEDDEFGLDDDDDDLNDDENKKNDKQNSFVYSSIIYMNLKVATGFGFLTKGKTLFSTKNLEITSGLLYSPISFRGDLYFMASKKLSIGLDGYIQSFSSDVNPSWGISLMSKYQLSRGKNYKFLLGGGIGYGDIAFKVDVPQDPKQSVDIVKASIININTEATFIILFSKNFGISSTLKVDFVVPSISVVADLVLGIYLEF